MNPLTLIVRKSRKLGKYNLVVFNTVARLDKSDTSKLLYSFGNGGQVKTDAQFCKMIYDSFGEGTYLVFAYSKGLRGFWNFYMAELSKDGFTRIKSNNSQKNKEKEKTVRKINSLKKELGKPDTDKEFIKEEIEDLKEELDLDQEIDELMSKGKRSGPYPYLKQLKPLFNFHGYEEVEREEEVNVEESFW